MSIQAGDQVVYRGQIWAVRRVSLGRPSTRKLTLQILNFDGSMTVATAKPHLVVPVGKGYKP